MPRVLKETESAEAPPRWPIAVLLLAALLIRLLGMGYGLPYAFSPDEERTVDQAFRFAAYPKMTMMAPDDPSKPVVSSYVTAAVYGGWYGISSLVGRMSSLMEFRYDFMTRPTPYYYMARLLSTAFGLFSIYLLYVIGCTAFDWGAGLVAAAMLAFSHHHVAYSQLATPDMLALVFLLAGVYYTMMLLIEKRIALSLFAGLLMGLAAGTSFRFVVFLPVLAFAYLVVVPRDYKPAAVLLGIALTVLCCLAGILGPNSAALYNAPRTLIEGMVSAFAFSFTPAAYSDAGATLKHAALFDLYSNAIGPAFLAAGLFGLLWGAVAVKWKRLRFAVLLIALILPAGLYFPSGPAAFARWAFLMTAPLAMGAGFFVYRIFWRKGMPATLSIVLMTVFSIALLAQGVGEIGTDSTRKSGADTRHAFATWALANLPDSARVLATENARFLLDRKDLSGGPRWNTYRPKVLARYNNRAFDLTVVPLPPLGVHLLSDYDYLVVDTWTLSALDFLSASPPPLDSLLPVSPVTQSVNPARASKTAARFLKFVKTVRDSGRTIHHLPEPPPSRRAFGPGIEVIEVSPTTVSEP